MTEARLESLTRVTSSLPKAGRIMHTLLEHGVVIEKFHHEVAPGQLEFSIRYDTPMKIADQVMLSKHLVNQIAEKYNLTATFKPKPLAGANGSGMHIHLKIMHKNTQENLFYDPEGDCFLSKTACHFIAGILNRIADGSIVLNSSENSYKRLVPGYEAPLYICWASKNRSALVRIPLVNEEQSHTTRIEVRSSDALCNPYLAFSFLMKAGVAGIVEKEHLVPPTEENLFKLSIGEIEKRGIKTLPTSLKEALSNFEQSPYIKELFNETLIREFVKIKSQEVE
jgi:glutamine synthetase